MKTRNPKLSIFAQNLLILVLTLGFSALPLTLEAKENSNSNADKTADTDSSDDSDSKDDNDDDNDDPKQPISVGESGGGNTGKEKPRLSYEEFEKVNRLMVIGESGGGYSGETDGESEIDEIILKEKYRKFVGESAGESGGGIIDSYKDPLLKIPQKQFVGESGGGIPFYEIHVGGLNSKVKRHSTFQEPKIIDKAQIIPSEFNVTFAVGHIFDTSNFLDEALGSPEFKEFMNDLEKAGFKIKESDISVKVNEALYWPEDHSDKSKRGKLFIPASGYITVYINDQTVRWTQIVQNQITVNPNTGRAKNCGTDIRIVYTLKKLKKITHKHRSNILASGSGGNDCIWYENINIDVDQAPIGSLKSRKHSEGKAL